MNVLSLCDGMSGGQLAFDKIGIKFDGVKNKYFASEIDKKVIKVTQHNFPNTIQIGNIIDVKSGDLPKIDILIGGTPCQGFSISGKKLNFEDPRSKLIFEYIRLKNELKPKYFLLENVRMPDDIADAIDELMGVKRILINSVDFTGHIRKRYYWTNIPISEWEKKDLKIEDIIDNTLPYDKDIKFFLDRCPYAPTTSSDGIITINPKDNNGKQTWQRGRVYDIKGKCPTMCASLFDLNITKDHKTYRKLVREQWEKLQGVPKGYTSVVSDGEAGKMLGNGWNIDTIAHILKGIENY
jgi:hypothetical protein